MSILYVQSSALRACGETLYAEDSYAAREVSSPDDPLFWSVQSSPAPVEWLSNPSELGFEKTAVTKAVSSGGDTSSSEFTVNSHHALRSIIACKAKS